MSDQPSDGELMGCTDRWNCFERIRLEKTDSGMREAHERLVRTRAERIEICSQPDFPPQCIAYIDPHTLEPDGLDSPSVHIIHPSRLPTVGDLYMRLFDVHLYNGDVPHPCPWPRSISSRLVDVTFEQCTIHGFWLISIPYRWPRVSRVHFNSCTVSSVEDRNVRFSAVAAIDQFTYLKFGTRELKAARMVFSFKPIPEEPHLSTITCALGIGEELEWMRRTGRPTRGPFCILDGSTPSLEESDATSAHNAYHVEAAGSSYTAAPTMFDLLPYEMLVKIMLDLPHVDRLSFGKVDARTWEAYEGSVRLQSSRVEISADPEFAPERTAYIDPLQLVESETLSPTYCPIIHLSLLPQQGNLHLRFASLDLELLEPDRFPDCIRQRLTSATFDKCRFIQFWIDRVPDKWPNVDRIRIIDCIATVASKYSQVAEMAFSAHVRLDEFVCFSFSGFERRATLMRFELEAHRECDFIQIMRSLGVENKTPPWREDEPYELRKALLRPFGKARPTPPGYRSPSRPARTFCTCRRH